MAITELKRNKLEQVDGGSSAAARLSELMLPPELRNEVISPIFVPRDQPIIWPRLFKA